MKRVLIATIISSTGVTANSPDAVSREVDTLSDCRCRYAKSTLQLGRVHRIKVGKNEPRTMSDAPTIMDGVTCAVV